MHTTNTFGPTSTQTPQRKIRKLTLPAVAVAAVGGLAVTLASEVPTIVGVLGSTKNHNEILLRPDHR